MPNILKEKVVVMTSNQPPIKTSELAKMTSVYISGEPILKKEK
jgi:hypothetical protein